MQENLLESFLTNRVLANTMRE